MKWTQHPQSFLIILFSSPLSLSLCLNSPKEIPSTHFSACLFFSSVKEKAPLTSGSWPGTIS